MKGIRVLLVVLAAALALVVLAVVVVMNPSFQRWAVLTAAAGQPGTVVELDRVAIGSGRFEVGGLRVNRRGVALQVDLAIGEYRLWPLVLGRRIEIGKLTVRGVRIDATALDRVAASAGMAAPAAAPGALGRVELPMALVLGTCEIDGEARLPGAKEGAPVEARFRLTGGGLAPGREGSFAVATTVRHPHPAAPVGSWQGQFALRITESTARTFTRVSLDGTLEAEGRDLGAPARLGVTAAYELTASSESYRARVDALRAGSAENLLTVQAELAAGADRYAGHWSLNVHQAQVEPFYPGGALPGFAAAGTGRLGFAPATGDFATQGELKVALQQLEQLDTRLGALGPVRLQSRFDLAGVAGVVRLNMLNVSLAAGPRPVLELEARQALELAPASGRVRFAGTSGEVVRLRLLAVPIAWVRPLVGAAEVSGGTLTGEITVRAEGARHLASSVAPLQIDELNVVRNGKPLVLKGAVSMTLGAEFAGEGGWKAGLSELLLTTPEGDRLRAQLTVTRAGAPEAPGIHLQGAYQARLPSLLRPHIEGLQVQAEGELDIGVTGAQVRVDTLTSRVRTLDDQPVFSTEVRQPFIFSMETKAITPGGPAAELMRVDMGRLALAPLLGHLIDGLAGSVTQGSFSLEAESGGWRLRPVAPIVLTGLELAGNGRPLLGGVALEFAPLVNMSADGAWKVQLGEARFHTREGTPLGIVRGELAQDSGGTRVNGGFQLELPALVRLPAFPGAAALEQGRAVGEIRAVADEQGEQVEARATLNGLAVRGGGAPLPVANFSVRARRDARGGVKIDLPILLDRAGIRTDMNLAATLTRGEPGHRLNARLTAGHAALDDLLALAGVFVATAREGARTPAGRTNAMPVVADELPPWGRVAGEVGLDFKTLTYGPGWSAQDLRGTLQVQPARVSVPIIEAAFGEEGRLEAHGEITFAPGARPYRFAGGFAVTEFDAGPLFKAIDPARAPTIEGRFNVEGRFDGDGRTLAETLERTRGEFQLTSRQGVFRGLRRGTEKVSVATRAVELGAALGSIFGSDKVRGAAEKVAGGAYFADQLAQEFGELPYDQLNVRLERGESLDMKLTDVTLISPEVRLVGQGTVTYVEGQPLLAQPLNVEMNLGGRGKVETLLARANLLVEPAERDELGYAKARYPVVIAGSIAKPDALSFYARLATAKLLDSLPPEY